MRRTLDLQTRIFLILAALFLITALGGATMIWYTFRMERLLAVIVDRHVAAFETAQSLENALVNQKGFVSYYFLDGNPDWLRQLGEYRQIFKSFFDKMLLLADTEEQVQSIDQVGREYHQYITIKDQVIDYYMAGEREAGRKLHTEVRKRFFQVMKRCEEFKRIVKNAISQASIRSQRQAEELRIIAGIGLGMDAVLAFLLVFILMKNILGPVRELARAANRRNSGGRSENEIVALSRSVQGLLEDVDFTHSELQKSREHLLQAEKMAVVGKLAAGMAHSIRNPFTSIKMRLFSLSRTLKMTGPQKEDFDVISEEIRHLDTIVQNFLEFSRPPKLRMQRVSPSVVVDMTLQLLTHRLRSYDVAVTIERGGALPEVTADPEQLKEVLVNLLINACEAMGKDGGGKIVITEKAVLSEDPAHPGGKQVVIEVKDNGPGIPEDIREKIFQPFFTTKEDGTGLGLSIASRIIREHQGRLEVDSSEDRGTTFMIRLPACGEGRGEGA